GQAGLPRTGIRVSSGPRSEADIIHIPVLRRQLNNLRGDHCIGVEFPRLASREHGILSMTPPMDGIVHSTGGETDSPFIGPVIETPLRVAEPDHTSQTVVKRRRQDRVTFALLPVLRRCPVSGPPDGVPPSSASSIDDLGKEFSLLSLFRQLEFRSPI